MHRDQTSGQTKHAKAADRREWGHPRKNEHDSDNGDRDRFSGRLQRTYGVRQEEAARQIRELRARY